MGRGKVKKLAALWTGPHEVLEKTGLSTYKIVACDNRRKRLLAYAARLKPKTELRPHLKGEEAWIVADP